MMENFPEPQESCVSESLTSYVDGELTPAEESSLELHLAACPDCRLELNSQKNFMGELTRTLGDANDFELPQDFTKRIIVNAESHVTGLRHSSERSRALFVCFGLLLVASIGLGGDVLGLFENAAEKSFAIADMAFHMVLNVSTGVAVILRTFSAKAIFGSAASIAFVAVLFAGSLFLCSRLIPRSGR